MKLNKIFPYTLSLILYYLGHNCIKLTYIKNKRGEYICDKYRVLNWFATVVTKLYGWFMRNSMRVQERANLEEPWKLVKRHFVRTLENPEGEWKNLEE